MVNWCDGIVPLAQRVWEASWQASVIALLVMAVQLAFARWLAPRWRVAMWSVVFIRLLLPVSPSSDWSIFNLMPRSPVIVESVIFIERPDSQPVFASPAIAITTTDPLPRPQPPAMTWHRAAAGIWLAGVCVVAVMAVVMTLMMVVRLRSGRTMRDPAVLAEVDRAMSPFRLRSRPRIIEHEGFATPALFGIVRPCLVVPAGFFSRLEPDEIRHVLMHEAAHLSRHDLAKNWLLLGLMVAHWFNPILWFAFVRYRADRELACDAMTLQRLADDEAIAYGRTLLNVLERTLRPTSTPLLIGIGENMRQMQARVRAIASHRRRLSRWSLLGAVPLVLLATVTLTSAQPRKSESTTKAQLKPVQLEATPQELPAPTPSADDIVRAKLAKPIPATFDQNKLRNVLEYIRNVADVDMNVDWAGLQNAGIEPDAMVTVNVQNTTAEKALRLVLSQVSAGNKIDPLAYTIHEGIVEVGTTGSLKRKTLSTRAYDIRDLLATASMIDPKGFDRAEAVRALTNLIYTTSNIGGKPTDWDVNSELMRINELNGMLIVHTYTEGHREIAALLAQLREAIGLSVSIESHVLLLDRQTYQGLWRKRGESFVYLDDANARAMIKQAGELRSSRVIKIARVTMFNGGSAQASHGTQMSYIAQVNRRQAAEGVVREPELKTLEEGIRLSYASTVSADRKFTTVQMNLGVSRVADVQRTPLEDAPTEYVENPVVEKVEAVTTVSIPDGGTLALVLGEPLSKYENLDGPLYAVVLVRPVINQSDR